VYVGHAGLGSGGGNPGQPQRPTGDPANRANPATPAGNRKKAAKPTIARKRRISGPSRAYVAMWAVLAGVSMAYLAVLTVNPEVLVAIGPPVVPADPESNQGQRFAAKLATDVKSLQQTVTELRGEVTALRTNPPMSVKASAPFDWQSVQTNASANAPDERTPEAKLQARLGTPLDGTRVAGMVITSPGVVTQPASGPAAANLPLGLELVTGPSVDALRLNWGVLAERHGATLKNMEARYNAASQTGPFQLLAGPVASADEGFRLCEQFRVKGTPCKVGPFGGHGF
jgi:predicted RNA methylase